MEKESDHKEDLEASIAQLDVKVEQLTKDVAEATAQIAEPQLNLQRASWAERQITLTTSAFITSASA